jgi:hypothetical protein
MTGIGGQTETDVNFVGDPASNMTQCRMIFPAKGTKLKRFE